MICQLLSKGKVSPKIEISPLCYQPLGGWTEHFLRKKKETRYDRFYPKANTAEAHCGKALKHTKTQHVSTLAVQCTANHTGKVLVSLFCVGVQRAGGILSICETRKPLMD